VLLKVAIAWALNVWILRSAVLARCCPGGQYCRWMFSERRYVSTAADVSLSRRWKKGWRPRAEKNATILLKALTLSISRVLQLIYGSKMFEETNNE
jgi:hypothetical protein